MSLFRSLAFLEHRNPRTFIFNLDVSQKRYLFNSIFRRTNSVPPEPESISSEENPKWESQRKMKQLAVFFKEALGLSPRTEEPTRDNEGGTSDLSRDLKQLESKIRGLNKKHDSVNVDEVEVAEAVAEAEEEVLTGKDIKTVAPSLSSVFMKRSRRRGEWGRLPEASVTIEKLSPETEMFLNHLHTEGYFNGASFMRNGRLESDWYKHSCGRDFIKSASDKFGKDHKEIAK